MKKKLPTKVYQVTNRGEKQLVVASSPEMAKQLCQFPNEVEEVKFWGVESELPRTKSWRVTREGQLFRYFQPNPLPMKEADKVGDCVLRALCKVLSKEWVDVFEILYKRAKAMYRMPNSQEVFEGYLEEQGYRWTPLKAEKGKSRITVVEFAEKNPCGSFMVQVSNHVVAVVDGLYYDSWNSGEKALYGFWSK